MYVEFSIIHGLELNMNSRRGHIIYLVSKMATLDILICIKMHASEIKKLL